MLVVLCVGGGAVCVGGVLCWWCCVGGGAVCWLYLCCLFQFPVSNTEIEKDWLGFTFGVVVFTSVFSGTFCFCYG